MLVLENQVVKSIGCVEFLNFVLFIVTLICIYLDFEFLNPGLIVESHNILLDLETYYVILCYHLILPLLF